MTSSRQTAVCHNIMIAPSMVKNGLSLSMSFEALTPGTYVRVLFYIYVFSGLNVLISRLWMSTSRLMNIKAIGKHCHLVQQSTNLYLVTRFLPSLSLSHSFPPWCQHIKTFQFSHHRQISLFKCTARRPNSQDIKIPVTTLCLLDWKHPLRFHLRHQSSSVLSSRRPSTTLRPTTNAISKR